MDFKMLGPGFAAEVTGVDPTRPIASAQADELRALLDRHELLVFRGATGLAPTMHVSFVNIFCSVWDERQDKSQTAYVSNVIGSFPMGRLLFHQDYAFTPWPHRVQSLYAE